jgi:UDP-N-acetylglucosamine 2-epimerase (non-hydrolysing)/GDP/UDP-N,N'-diacetylbacillosamine 2-epimerase (hydrolysing)
MGEEPWRITFSGSLSLDHLRRERLLKRKQVEKKLGMRISDEMILCIYHPVTLMRNTVEESAEVFASLHNLNRPVIFIYPNADAGSREIIHRAEKFAAVNDGSRVLVNLDHRTYLSLLSNVRVLVGNSSSGIIESTSLGIPAVNVGIRQQGREHAANVIDAPAERKAIRRAIDRALSSRFRSSIRGLKGPYGDGRASTVITKTLMKTPIGPKLLFKRVDLV